MDAISSAQQSLSDDLSEEDEEANVDPLGRSKEGALGNPEITMGHGKDKEVVGTVPSGGSLSGFDSMFSSPNLYSRHYF